MFYLATLILHHHHRARFVPRGSEDSCSSARDNLSHTYERFKFLLSSKAKWGLWNPIWGDFQTQFGLFTLGTLIKSYITRKPPIAPNLKQLSQLLLPTKPHGGSLRRGLCLGWGGGQSGHRFNIKRGHVLMLLWKCFLWSIRLQSPS